MNLTPEVIERFWAKVDKNGPVPLHRPELGPCWIWTAGKFPNGYGQFHFDGGPKYAHRISYEIHFGPIPKWLRSCHHCDNRSCVRGSHLFSGTQKQNIQDAVSKGRMAHGDTHMSITHPERLRRGSENAASKLTEHQVKQIWQMICDGLHDRKIAATYGINRITVQAIANRRIWRHLDLPGTPPVRTGLGERHGRSKLTSDQVKRIRELSSSGNSRKEVAEMFGVSRSCIGLIVLRKKWAHLQ